MSYAELFKAWYPPRFVSQRPDFYPDNYYRPLKCEVCGTKVARWGWRKHGNPRCGPHAGPVDFDRLPILEPGGLFDLVNKNPRASYAPDFPEVF